ncbi:MAG: IS3 family transposase, partial [Silvanigrellaceae bacterium]|nr:IS3 family transposase [Silvanigrellaceae bacterium]
EQILKIFVSSRKLYGKRRVQATLKKQRLPCSLKLVAKLMKKKSTTRIWKTQIQSDN